MAIEILNLTEDTDLASVTLKVINPSDWTLIDSKYEGQTREAVYQLVGSDPEHPAVVRIGHYRSNGSAKETGGVTNISIKFSTWVKDDTDADDVVWSSCLFTLATSMPGQSGVPDSADYLIGIQNLVSWFARTVTAGALLPATVDKLKFGIPNVL
jgi:hypothetical protein